MLVSDETGGLGNRIKSWVSAQRLDANARVFWPLTDNMPAPFHTLFENDVAVSELPADAQTYRSWRLAVLPEDEAQLPGGFAVVGAGAHPLLRAVGAAWWKLRGRPDDRYRYMLFPKQHSRRSTRSDARHIDLEYGRIPQPLRDVWQPYFDAIRPVESIRQRVADWWDTHAQGTQLIGVQVRTWRDDPRRYRKYHLPARKRLAQLMQDAHPQSRFLVVSDSDEFVEQLIAESAPGRVLTYGRDTAREKSWASHEGVAEDLIDMLLLARCSTLFASYLSTFSETAWWLGGTRAQVSVF